NRLKNASRHQAELARRHPDRFLPMGHFEATQDHGDDLHLACCQWQVCSSRGFVSVYQEQKGVGQRPALQGAVTLEFSVNELGLKIIKINACEGFICMKIARFTIQSDSIPIEDAVGGV